VNDEPVEVLAGLSNSFGIDSTSSVGYHIVDVAGELTNKNYILLRRISELWFVDKALGAALDGPPILCGKPTASSVTVHSVTLLNNKGNQKPEYAVSTSNALSKTAQNALSWQADTIFNVSFLTRATYTVYVYARSAENGNYYAGVAQVSEAITVDTDHTEIDGIPQTNPLKAWVQNGRLYVSGLTAGKPWRVISLSGVPLRISMADSEEADISLPVVQGVYIVQSENRTVKVKN
jgi:hypothetical protein